MGVPEDEKIIDYGHYYPDRTYEIINRRNELWREWIKESDIKGVIKSSILLHHLGDEYEVDYLVVEIKKLLLGEK